MQKIKTNTLILGAGWSGLVAADLLQKKHSNDIVILEKEGDVGGLARTFNFKGFKFDIGGHGLFFKNRENHAYLKRIIKNNDGIKNLKRKSKVLFNNKYIDYPINLSSVVKLGEKYILNILFDMFRLKNNHQENNFEEWVKANYGECLYRVYFKDYTEKVWGLACNELSAGWAHKRIGNNNLFRLFKSTFTGNKYCKENRRLFSYPHGGIGVLSNLLEQKNKYRVYKNVQLKQFSLSDSKLIALSFIYNGQPYEISFKQVISSIPIVELGKVFPYSISLSIQKIMQGIKYRNLILVTFIINKRLLTNWHWCYFPSKEVMFSRTYEPKFWCKDMAPEDKTLLCMEIFCNSNDSYWSMGEERLIELAQNALKYTRLLDSFDAVLDVSIKKIEYAYPLQYSGFEEPLNQIKDFFRTFKNLHLIGRNGTHSYFDMEECLDDVRGKVVNL